MKNLTVIGRRWFQRTYGNTYHSVRVIADGQEVGRVPFAYGYGDAWEQTARQMLTEKGLMPASSDPLRLQCERMGVELHRTVADVARKGDL